MNRFKVLRSFSYVLELLILFMLEQTPGLIPAVYGGRPILLIPAAFAIALFENETTSMLLGLFAGLLLDMDTGGALGFHAILLCVLCYVLSLLAANLIKTNFLTAMLSALLGLAVIVFLQWVFFYVLYGYADTGYALLHHFLPRYVYSLLVMPIAYPFNRTISLALRPHEE